MCRAANRGDNGGNGLLCHIRVLEQMTSHWLEDMLFPMVRSCLCSLLEKHTEFILSVGNIH